jgi:hypothetical protein
MYKNASPIQLLASTIKQHDNVLPDTERWLLVPEV